MRLRTGLLAVTALAGLAAAGPANASLVLFKQFSGAGYAKSTDGCGSTTQMCDLTANLPAGSTVQAAYLYTSLFSLADPNGTTLKLGATTVAPLFTALGVNSSFLQAWRADVTTLLTGLAVGANTLKVTENQSSQDGAALVVVYNDPLKPVSSVIILDGFSASTGDTVTIATPAYLAGGTMRIGDGFSFDGSDPNNPTGTGQVSTITVNGTVLTNVAGHCDDAKDASCTNGNLITVGGDADPFTPFPNPLVGQDHEFYNLDNVVLLGATSIKIDTLNASGDDNIFLEVFDFNGQAVVVTPEPASLALLGAGLLGLGLLRSRKRS